MGKMHPNDTKIACAAPTGVQGRQPRRGAGRSPAKKILPFLRCFEPILSSKVHTNVPQRLSRSMGFGVASQPTFSVASPALLLRLLLLLWQLRCKRAIGGLDGPTAARTSMHDAPHDALAARRLCSECRASAQPVRRGAAPYGDASQRLGVPKTSICLSDFEVIDTEDLTEGIYVESRDKSIPHL